VNIEDLLIASTSQRRSYTADQVIAAMEGAVTNRTTIHPTYLTNTAPAAVYYTALYTDGTILTSRRTSGVTLANGLYGYDQSVVGIIDFLAVWDEGNVNDYVTEWIVVDT
jgi:hypothetical protein